MIFLSSIIVFHQDFDWLVEVIQSPAEEVRRFIEANWAISYPELSGMPGVYSCRMRVFSVEAVLLEPSDQAYSAPLVVALRIICEYSAGELILGGEPQRGRSYLEVGALAELTPGAYACSQRQPQTHIRVKGCRYEKDYFAKLKLIGHCIERTHLIVISLEH
jgi:hypothetical protein